MTQKETQDYAQTLEWRYRYTWDQILNSQESKSNKTNKLTYSSKNYKNFSGTKGVQAGKLRECKNYEEIKV